MTKDFLNALADTLMGPATLNNNHQATGITRAWYLCTPRRNGGGIKRTKVTDIFSAERMMLDYRALGVQAWVEDKEGNPVYFARQSSELN